MQDSFSGIRTVKLSSTVEARGTHTFQMTWFRDARGRHRRSLGDRVLGRRLLQRNEQVDLVHGRKYLVDLFYRDAVCNPAQSAGSIEVTFASNYTLLPYFYNPLPEAILGSTFTTKFTLVEAGTAGTVKLTLAPVPPSGQRALPMYAATALTTRPRGTAC